MTDIDEAQKVIADANREAQAEAALQPSPEQTALYRELTLAGLHADLAAAKAADLTIAAAHLQAEIRSLHPDTQPKAHPPLTD